MAIFQVPMVEELADFNFVATPVHEPQVHDLAAGGSLASKRNIVLVGGTRQQQFSQKPLRIRPSIGYTVQHQRRRSAHQSAARSPRALSACLSNAG